MLLKWTKSLKIAFWRVKNSKKFPGEQATVQRRGQSSPMGTAGPLTCNCQGTAQKHFHLKIWSMQHSFCWACFKIEKPPNSAERFRSFHIKYAHDCSSRVGVGLVDRWTCSVLGHLVKSYRLWLRQTENSKLGTTLIERKVTQKISRRDLKQDSDVRRPSPGKEIHLLPEAAPDPSQIMPDTNLLQDAAGPFFRSRC